MPVGTSNKAQNDVIRKKASGSGKVQTDEDIEFKKKQAEEKKAIQAAAAKAAGKKKWARGHFWSWKLAWWNSALPEVKALGG